MFEDSFNKGFLQPFYLSRFMVDVCTVIIGIYFILKVPTKCLLQSFYLSIYSRSIHCYYRNILRRFILVEWKHALFA